MKSTDWPASSAERGMAADRTEAVRCVPRPEYGVRPQDGSGPLYGGDEAARRADLRGASAAVRQRREERTELMAWFGKKLEEREIQGSDPFLMGRTEAAERYGYLSQNAAQWRRISLLLLVCREWSDDCGR